MSNQRLVQNRIVACKSQPHCHHKQEESEKIARDVQDFIDNGGEVHTYWAGDANFKSDLEKANSQKVKHLKHKKQERIFNYGVKKC